ncbi:MAG: Hsp70 family protein, partial [Clostridia bacterium]|nr:Hsp70 family protein [Clostridia bacterium]
NVSARDKGTGKEQHITITSSTSMDKADIERAVKDAEKYAAEDAKRREEVDIRNNADQMIYQTEKLLDDMGDKVDSGTKSAVQSKIADLRAVKDSAPADEVKAKTDALQQELYKLSEQLYKDAGAQGGPQGGAYDAGFDDGNGGYNDVDNN